MTLPAPPNITAGQIALDPVNGIVYYVDDNGDKVATTWSWLQSQSNEINISSNKNVSIGQDLTVSGDLIIQGDTVSLNVSEVLVEDNILILNSNYTGAPSLNAGIEVERGSETNVQIRWNESTDTWQYTNDGTTFYDINSITPNSIQLGYHTTGSYVATVSAGTGVSISHTPGEGSTPSFSIGQSVSTTDNVIFNNVTSALTGNVTGTVSDISNHGISDLSDVTITDAVSGDFLRYSGSAWINDPVNLTTDTVGDYVSHLAAGTGITITNNSGEGSTPNISFSGSINDLSDLTITSAQNGQILEYDGTTWVNTVRPSSEPMGFENADDSSITFSNSTREFTISPASSSFTIWSVGKRYVKTTSESISLPNLSNLYYIYYNTSGALAYKTTFFTLSEDTPVAYVYWNQTDGVAHFIADERHGVTLDWATHEYLHRTRGAAIANGFGVNNYTTSGNGSLDSHAQIDIAQGTFFDEDLRIVITNSATPSSYSHQQILQGGGEFPVFYRTNSHYRRDAATKFPMKTGSSRVTYNLFSGGLWSTPDIDSNKFGISYLVATNDLNDPIFAMMGQAQYTDQGSAEAASWNDMNLDDFPVAEFRILYKLIYQTSNAYANTPKARLTGVQDLRVSFISGGNLATVPVSDHGTMTGLSDDDHTQYFNSSRHDAHDHTTALASASLNDLGDVIITSATPNQVLKYDGTNWVNAAAPGSVSASSADRTTEGVIYGKTPSTFGTVFLGYNSGSSVVSGNNNVAIGDYSLNTVGSGSANIAIGNSALRNTTDNSYSVAIGYEAGLNAGGGENIAIGYQALRAATGQAPMQNIAIGTKAGYSLSTTASRNVFIGYEAGYNETGSNKLYISNSNTSSPLIKGDFDSSTVEINGSLAYRQAFNNQGINTMVYLTSSDKGKVVTFNTSSNVTVYVNNFANLVAGERIDLLNLGTGTVSISGSGVTINGTPGLKLRAQYSAGSLLCLSNNSSYVLIGDLAA